MVLYSSPVGVLVRSAGSSISNEPAVVLERLRHGYQVDFVLEQRGVIAPGASLFEEPGVLDQSLISPPTGPDANLSGWRRTA